jgi:hypothetical protein
MERNEERQAAVTSEASEERRRRGTKPTELLRLWAISAVVAQHDHTVKVGGSNPSSPNFLSNQGQFRVAINLTRGPGSGITVAEPHPFNLLCRSSSRKRCRVAMRSLSLAAALLRSCALRSPISEPEYDASFN